MADITILGHEELFINAGQRSHRVFRGTGQFNSTDTSGELPIKNLQSVIDGAFFTCLNVQDEGIAIDETVSATTLGRIAIPSDRKITLIRDDAAPTSGLKFFFEIKGH